MVTRIYVEKKEGTSPKAQQLCDEIKNFLGVGGLTSVRELVRYDVEGAHTENIATDHKVLTTIFAEPPVDDIYLEDYPQKEGFEHTIVVEALPGQFDQRADSCAQCIQLLRGGERPLVSSAMVYEFKGDISTEDLKKIENYLVNPVESHRVSLQKPKTLQQKIAPAKKVPQLHGFSRMNKDELETMRTSYGLAMDLADLLFLQKHFATEEQRDPTLTELRVIDTYWSDHCRHTTFSTHLTDIECADDATAQAYKRYLALRAEVYGEDEAEKRPQTLMDIATLGTKVLKKRGRLPELDASEEINACSIHMPALVDGKEQDWLFMFKNETHNHPTEIEPFGGAATCIGGCIRDPLSGRAYVHQAMRITGAGDPRTPYDKTLAAKLPQKKIVTTAAEGYSSYGNQIGLATGFVHELYDEGFLAKHLECGAVVAAAPADHVKREAPAPGDVVVLLGGRTGRDGIGGATGSSKSHSTTSLDTMASEVQKGNAPEERKIQRFFRQGEVTRLIKRCNDFGAGGVSVAIGELAPGLEIDLDAIRKKYQGMDGTELAISESQERMACVVAAEDVDTFCQLAAQENLEAYPVARVTEEPRMKMMWQGQEIANLSRAFLDTNGADRAASVSVCAPPSKVSASCKESGAKETDTHTRSLKDLMRNLHTASQRGLVERFDSTVGAASLFMPYGGRYQRTPVQAMAALLPVAPGAHTKQASLMAYGCDLEELKRNPYQGSYQSIVDSLAKIVAAGADYKQAYLTLQEYFEKLENNPVKWGKPFGALLGALDAQIDFEAAAIGGKDSMSGTFMDLNVPPTLLSFAVAPVQSDKLISNEFKAPNHYVYFYWGCQDGCAYEVHRSAALKAGWERYYKLVQEGKIQAAYALDKTPAEAIVAMSFGNGIGFVSAEAAERTKKENTSYSEAPQQKDAQQPPSSGSAPTSFDWFGRYPGALIIETAEPLSDSFASLVGMTQTTPVIELAGQKETLSELQALNESVLEDVYPTTVPSMNQTNPPCIRYAGPAGSTHARHTTLSPRVLIPVFPGTNCEYDSARACMAAGLDPHIQVIKNLTPSALEESVALFEKNLSEAQILFLPGGFSGGDEPAGSAKFIVSFLKHPRLTDAIHQLLNERDGLILGICNGFQALIKLGLVPFGHILDVDSKAPALTYNRIGRHQSSIVHTRIASTKSPWLQNVQVGDVVEVPISHGEGRFVAPLEVLKQLSENGQIATQYCDLDGHPSLETRYNPNGSDWAIEGITSPDGRILGKMGHSERIGQELYKNVPGQYDLGLFQSAADYFA